MNRARRAAARAILFKVSQRCVADNLSGPSFHEPFPWLGVWFARARRPVSKLSAKEDSRFSVVVNLVSPLHFFLHFSLDTAKSPWY
jgi:hypothetical protein